MSATRTTAAPALELVHRPDEITHIVCCRDVPWRTAFCGVEGATGINPGALHLCSMCIEEAQSRRPGWLLEEPSVCPVDGQLCPDDEEIDARIARETGGSA